VAFDATDRLLIIYSALAQYLRKMGKQLKVHQLFIDLKKTYDSVGRENLSKILIEFGNPRKHVRLINIILTKTYSRVGYAKMCLTGSLLGMV